MNGVDEPTIGGQDVSFPETREESSFSGDFIRYRDFFGSPKPEDVAKMIGGIMNARFTDEEKILLVTLHIPSFLARAAANAALREVFTGRLKVVLKAFQKDDAIPQVLRDETRREADAVLRSFQEQSPSPARAEFPEATPAFDEWATFAMGHDMEDPKQIRNGAVLLIGLQPEGQIEKNELREVAETIMQAFHDNPDTLNGFTLQDIMQIVPKLCLMAGMDRSFDKPLSFQHRRFFVTSDGVPAVFSLIDGIKRYNCIIDAGKVRENYATFNQREDKATAAFIARMSAQT